MGLRGSLRERFVVLSYHCLEDRAWRIYCGRQRLRCASTYTEALVPPPCLQRVFQLGWQ